MFGVHNAGNNDQIREKRAQGSSQGFQVNAAKDTYHAQEVTNTWIHHLEIVLSTMVVAILVLVCCTKTTNRSAPLLLVANVGPPRNSVNMVRGGGMLTKQGSVPMINRQRLDACLRRFQIQS